MSRDSHFSAYDFDCEDADPFPVARPVTAPPRTTRRRIVERRVVGDGPGERVDTLVQCPLRARWPSFDECSSCERWKGYSLDPSGQESFVSCASLDPLPSLAVALARAEWSPGARTPVSAVMSDPICVRGEVGLAALASLFAARRIGGAPVVDDDGKPIGMISRADLARCNPRLTALEAMTPGVVSLVESASVADAAALMATKEIHRVVVVSRSGHVVGIASTLDVARWLASNDRACPGNRAVSAS
jgi:CBS domain-containing protein